MIAFYDFIRMTECEQAEAVWQGEYLGQRFDEELVVQLYNLESFYAEVFM